MSLHKNLVRFYYKLRLPKNRWHIISVLPNLKLKNCAALNHDVKEIYYKGKFIAKTSPLTELKQRKQKNCFIVATGPSIQTLDLTQLQNKFLIGVNGATALITSHQLKFSLYIVMDPSFVKHRFELVKAAIHAGTPCLFSYKVIDAICKQDSSLLQHAKLYLIQEINKRYDGITLPTSAFYDKIKNNPQLITPISKTSNNPIGFSRNIEHGVFDGGTVTFWAAQVVYYIDFTNIFILGMDLHSKTGALRFYEKPSNQLPSYLEDDYESLIKPSFEALSHLMINEPIRFYNVSLQSRLSETILPKISFETALELCQ
ncbi:MAG: hypothetical protein A3E87_09930 [Gammaproteobacteria bacterium RIFCSPHIGHO2_12_FULL_35_23]|nr:MAG: hypothetical protein A3E87_09930 [Gammaproteobacteria bacterium RIFCSPHIGHO2_12_FULL_35_23]